MLMVIIACLDVFLLVAISWAVRADEKKQKTALNGWLNVHPGRHRYVKR